MFLKKLFQLGSKAPCLMSLQISVTNKEKVKFRGVREKIKFTEFGGLFFHFFQNKIVK